LLLDQLKRTDAPPISPDITFTDFTENENTRNKFRFTSKFLQIAGTC
jgi:hypothetical protein